MNGRMDRVWEITDGLIKPLCGIRDRRIGNYIAMTKAGLELIGRAAGPVRPPLLDLAAEDSEDLKRILSFWIEIAG